MRKMCKACRGSGKILGGGFCQLVCEVCNGNGTIRVQVEGSDDRATDVSDIGKVKIDKRSKTYKVAIASIMEKSGLSESEAKKIFDEEMEKDAG